MNQKKKTKNDRILCGNLTELCFFSAACSQSYCGNAWCPGCFVFLVMHEQGKLASFVTILSLFVRYLLLGY